MTTTTSQVVMQENLYSTIKPQIKIPVYQPSLNGNEKKYVNQCLDTNWISSKGEFIHQFETSFSKYTNIPYTTSVCNGTAALHVALLALNIQPGDEIIVPTLTYVATVNMIVLMGAKPIFVDSMPLTWQMNVIDVANKITNKTRAIMAVHLYGHPCDMHPLMALCRQHQLFLIEDCAEAIGAYYHDQHVGAFGDIATFSFYGNKTCTTGEGGMVATKHAHLHKRSNNLKNQGVSHSLQYWHDVIGYNYRMTNICAAIGLAQLEKITEILFKKRRLVTWYQEALADLPLELHAETANVQHAYWMCSILLNEALHRDPLRKHLGACEIETRPVFYPIHLLPMYQQSHLNFPVAESLSSRGISLPSWPELTQHQVNYIAQCIKEYFLNVT